jgi:phosphonate transport system permease protein
MLLSKNIIVSIAFLAIGIICALFADFSISTLEPFVELKKFSLAIFDIDITQITELIPALLNTISIAVIAIFISSILGFLLALIFQSFFVRTTLAFTRAIHELFWALIFLQIFGLNTLTALLALIIPYSAILAKVYSEILEEHDTYPKELKGESLVSFYLYTKIPDAFPHLIAYTLYRFECALRSTAILGFVGITTLGYYLSSSFMQGYYNEVWLLLIMFYIVIATIRLWFNKYSVGFIIIASFFYIDEFPSINFDNFIRFITSDIVPHPIRTDAGLDKTMAWFTNIFTNEIIIGVANTILLTQVALVLTAILALVSFPFISIKFSNKFSRKSR